MKDTDDKMKILFLCHGNICRSPLAEFVMKELARRAGRDDIEVESAALHTDEIGNDIHYGTRRKLQTEGIPFAPRRAWLINAAKAREYDAERVYHAEGHWPKESTDEGGKWTLDFYASRNVSDVSEYKRGGGDTIWASSSGCGKEKIRRPGLG